MEARIKQELEANPALEEGAEREENHEDLDVSEQETSEALEDFDFDEYLDDETPDYQLNIRNHGADVEDRDIPLGSGSTFRELLVDQLGLLDESREIRALAEHLIGHLDDDGYLRRDLESIVNDLAFTQGVDVPKEQLEEALEVVQSLDPAGWEREICKNASSFRFEENWKKAWWRMVVIPHWSWQLRFWRITTKHSPKSTTKKLQSVLKSPRKNFEVAWKRLTRLNPKPGNSGSDSSRVVHHVILTSYSVWMAKTL